MIPKLTNEPGAIETAAQIRSGALSPLEAVDAAIARIEALDGPLNAVIVRDFDSRLRAGFSDRDLATLQRLLQRLADNAARDPEEGP